MDLKWCIQQYDWFGPVLEDKKFYEDEIRKQAEIIKLIQKESDIDLLEECIKLIPISTGSKIRNEIFKRISLLRIVYAK